MGDFGRPTRGLRRPDGERVLDRYEQSYAVDYSVVCLDESPKQLLEQQIFTAANGKRFNDFEYVRRGVAELFVATEPAAELARVARRG